MEAVEAHRQYQDVLEAHRLGRANDDELAAAYRAMHIARLNAIPTIPRKEPRVKKFLATAKQVLGLLAQLQVPTIATAVAGLVLPALTLLGVTSLSLPALAADIALFGSICAAIERLHPQGALNPKAKAARAAKSPASK